MNTDYYLLVLNATEGFLQLAIGDAPERLVLARGKNALEDGTGQAQKSAGSQSGADSVHPPQAEDGSLAFVSCSDLATSPKRLRKRGATPLKCSQEWRLPSQGTELLAPALRDVAARLGITMAQISHIACVTGPGSFTGIRLTTTSAGGLAMATGALMGGLSYLPLLALNASTVLQGVLRPHAVLWVVTHARRDLVHAQAFEVVPATSANVAKCDSGRCEAYAGLRSVQSEVLVLALDELAALVSAQKSAAFLLGSGVTRNRVYLQERLDETSVVLLDESFDVPQPSVLFEAACRAEYGSEELMPDYVRASDAEEALADIAVKLGLDAEEAQAAYLTLQKE